MPNKPNPATPNAPVDHATLAAELITPLRELHYLHPDDDEALADGIAALLAFCRKRKLFAPTPAKLTPKLRAAAGEQLADAITASVDRVSAEIDKHHASLSISTAGGSHYTFAAPYKVTTKKRTKTAVGLTSIDSDGKVFPTSKLALRVPQDIDETERDAARCAKHLLTAPPAILRSPAGLQDALDRLRADFPPGLPFRNTLHERRFRAWCVMPTSTP